MATWRDAVQDAAAITDRFLTSGGSVYDLRAKLKSIYPDLSKRDIDQLYDVVSRARAAGREATFDTRGDRLRVSGLPSGGGGGQDASGAPCSYVVHARGTWEDAGGKPIWGSVIALPYDRPPTLDEIAADVRAAQERLGGRTGDTLPSAVRGEAVFTGVTIVSAYKCR